jgi:hypothetical protein
VRNASAQAKERQDGKHDDHQADDIDNAVHTAVPFVISKIFRLTSVPGHRPPRGLQVCCGTKNLVGVSPHISKAPAKDGLKDCHDWPAEVG